MWHAGTKKHWINCTLVYEEVKLQEGEVWFCQRAGDTSAESRVGSCFFAGTSKDRTGEFATIAVSLYQCNVYNRF